MQKLLIPYVIPSKQNDFSIDICIKIIRFRVPDFGQNVVNEIAGKYKIF